MSTIVVKERDLVIPGEVLAEGLDYLPGDNTYREQDKIYSKVVGLASVSGRVVKITPLSGPYVPKVGDKIIGKVIDITFSGWRVDTGTAYSAMLNVKEATTRFIKKEENLAEIIAIGEYVVAKIVNVTSQNLIDLTMREPGLHPISGGRIIKINSQKVPRVIGKQGSMISLIKEKTGCEITVGQNGLVWLKGTQEGQSPSAQKGSALLAPEGELVAEKAVHLIEEKAHTEGLTERVQKFLNEQKSKVNH